MDLSRFRDNHVIDRGDTGTIEQRITCAANAFSLLPLGMGCGSWDPAHPLSFHGSRQAAQCAPRDGQDDTWIDVPAGTCEEIVAGSLTPKKR